MTFRQRIARWVATRAIKYAGIPLRDPALAALFGVSDATSGVNVNEDVSLNYSAVWSATNLISSAVGMMPAQVYNTQATTVDKQIATSHVATQLLSVSPNEYTTPFQMFEKAQADALLWGNGFIEVIRDNGLPNGVPTLLRPLLPNGVTPQWSDADELEYRVHGERDPDTGKERTVLAANMLHVRGLGDDLQGYSVIARAREAVGLGIATEKFGASFFGRGAVPGGVLYHPGELSTQAQDNLRESWNKKHGNGPENGNRIAILDEGMKYQPVGIPPEDAQFLQTRQFQVVEIARWFRVPPHMIYDLTQSTNNNIELQGLDFLVYTLMPWLTRWRQELNRKLLTPAEQKTHCIDFDPSVLLKADTKTRYETYSQGRNGGWLTLNDIMRSERRPLLSAEIGDTRIAPSTMKTLGSADPTTPIAPDVMTAATELVKNLGPMNRSAASTILRGLMPSAPDGLIGSIVDVLAKKGSVA